MPKIIVAVQSAEYPHVFADNCPFPLHVFEYKSHEPTTWTQGRNRLLETLPDGYDYVILCDDDIEFTRGDWNRFSQLLDLEKPEIATPYFEWHAKKENIVAFDACCNAYRTDTMHRFLPYDNSLDSESWHYSQLLVYDKVLTHLPQGVRQFLELEVENLSHGAYPRASNFDRVISEKFVNKEFSFAELLTM